MDVRKLERLKTQVEEARSKKQRAEGALEPLVRRLTDEFGCKDLEEATVKIKKLGDSIKSMDEEFEENLLELEKIVEGADE